MNKIAVSLLGVENNKRSEITNTLIDNGLSWVHYDVMDGIFVPNTAITFEEVKHNIENTKKHFIDIHLMVATASRHIEQFKDIADLITFHLESESTTELDKIIDIYSNSKFKLGVAINPKTNIEQLYPYLQKIDLVLIMSVQAGAGGQSFKPSTIDKISKLKKYIEHYNLDTLIEIDGGINDVTGPQVFEAGADAAVSGSFLCNEPTANRLESIKYKKKN